MKYTEFEDWMIGKRVRANFNRCQEGTGHITRQFLSNYNRGPGVWIFWDSGVDQGKELWLEFEDFVFLDETPNNPFQEITINGKRYKLTEIEE